MIAPLRRRHRAVSLTLLVGLPILYVVALRARPDEPVVDGLPAALTGPSLTVVEHEELDVYGDFEIAVRAGRDPGGWAVELVPAAPIARPEVLVYWSPSAAVDGELPDEARLLGELAGRRPRTFALPPEILGRSGYLTLYSLGHRQVLGSSELAAVGEPPPETGESGGETAAEAAP